MEREDITQLYEAAKQGCADTLKSLTTKDQLILHKVSLTSFTETPLHISSLLGHCHFTVALLRICPMMTTTLDTLQRSPLHLASAEGHVDIVRALLAVNDDVCLVRDEDGRVPLHLAAMRCNVDVVRELVSARREASFELLDGDTVFHLCVKFNHLKALKVLVELVNDDELINKGNLQGNTVLHLATMLKQLKTIEYLVSLLRVRERINSVNDTRLTPLDVLEQASKDFKSLEIRELLRESGAKRAVDLNNNHSTNADFVPKETNSSKRTSNHESWFAKCLKYIQYNVEETRGALMIVATVIATMTFEAALNPPGGVWQQNFTKASDGVACSDKNICEAGTSVLSYAYPDEYITFHLNNGIAFFGSLCVLALVISGFPLKSKLCVWLLAQAIGITLIFLGSTYVVGIVLLSPSGLRSRVRDTVSKMFVVWLGACFIGSFIDVLRYLAWIAKRVRRFWRKIRNRNKEHQQQQLILSGAQSNI